MDSAREAPSLLLLRCHLTLLRSIPLPCFPGRRQVSLSLLLTAPLAHAALSFLSDGYVARREGVLVVRAVNTCGHSWERREGKNFWWNTSLHTGCDEWLYLWQYGPRGGFLNKGGIQKGNADALPLPGMHKGEGTVSMCGDPPESGLGCGSPA